VAASLARAIDLLDIAKPHRRARQPSDQGMPDGPFMLPPKTVAGVARQSSGEVGLVDGSDTGSAAGPRIVDAEATASVILPTPELLAIRGGRIAGMWIATHGRALRRRSGDSDHVIQA